MNDTGKSFDWGVSNIKDRRPRSTYEDEQLLKNVKVAELQQPYKRSAMQRLDDTSDTTLDCGIHGCTAVFIANHRPENIARHGRPRRGHRCYNFPWLSPSELRAKLNADRFGATSATTRYITIKQAGGEGDFLTRGAPALSASTP